MTIYYLQIAKVRINEQKAKEKVFFFSISSRTAFEILSQRLQKVKGKVKVINERDIQINDRIRDPEVRVIGPTGEQLGIMSSREAYNKAAEMELDLVKISPNANPPVCKIIDFGKYRYELMKKEKEAKRNQKQVELKEIRMTPNIDTNDLNTKINAGRKFLTSGHK